jgi:hypothetical protein
MSNTKMHDAAASLMADIEQRETLNPNYYYEAKEYSIHRARELGLNDAAIERTLGITLRPEDKSGK